MLPADIINLPEKKRLLKLLQLRGDAGVKVYELLAPRPQGLGIAQYNRAIKELRDGKLDGVHYPIVNIKPGHFVLEGKSHSPITVVKREPLAGDKLRAWEQMGAFLSGRAPKPAEISLSEAQEALL